MPTRNILLAEGEIYHVFNRGVAKMPTFLWSKHYIRFLDLVNYYRFANLRLSYSSFNKLALELRNTRFEEMVRMNDLNISILGFCLMPNHFHFLLKQKNTDGISRFMHHLQDGYAKYFNITSNRVGPLYQASFKAVRIESDEQLLHVSRYMHINPTTAYLVNADSLHTYPWSSLNNYINAEQYSYPFVDTQCVLAFYKNREDYKKFVYDQIDYQRELHKIKHLLLE